MKQLNVAIVGITGMVGRKILIELEKSAIQVGKIKLFASAKSVGQTFFFRGKATTVEEATIEGFEGIDLAFFSAGSSVSAALIPTLIEKGVYVIDNTSHYRMDPTVPLLVPEVNFDAFTTYDTTLIANPNCSTIQMAVALQPLHEAFGLKKIIVSTYQAVSGAGAAASNELLAQQKAISTGIKMPTPAYLPVKSANVHYEIANNVIPQIDQFNMENGFTLEELKMMNETKKIFNLPELDVVATCVRVPVANGHSESVYVEFEQEVTLESVRTLLQNAKGVVLVDDLTKQDYPMPIYANGSSDVYVGRIRIDPHTKKGIHLFIVADNLLKGAASNSVQLAEMLVEQGHLGKK